MIFENKLDAPKSTMTRVGREREVKLISIEILTLISSPTFLSGMVDYTS